MKSKFIMYREVQLDFTPEMEVFYMLFERCYTENRKRSLKHYMKYFDFRSKIQLDHPVNCNKIIITHLTDFRQRVLSTSATACVSSSTCTPSRSTTTSVSPTASWPRGRATCAGTSISPPSSPTFSSTTTRGPTLPATSCKWARSRW